MTYVFYTFCYYVFGVVLAENYSSWHENAYGRPPSKKHYQIVLWLGLILLVYAFYRVVKKTLKP